MEFEWSEAKRLRVLQERGLDFRLAQALFDGRPIVTVASSRHGEARWLSVGELNGILLAVVWIERDGSTRIITMRRARDGEKKRYQALYG